jgi:hypothetical protein
LAIEPDGGRASMGDGVGRPSTAGPTYRAFISYSHAVDLASWRRQACGIVGALARIGSARFVPAGVRPDVCEPG